MTLKVAIIGSGPAGFYTAEALLKHQPDAQIDIIDKLPTPFGLIRAGVAPDHQSIKAVTRRYEETASRGDIAFFGNVEIGDAISIDALRGLYHAVVLATGAPADRKLGIPGDDLPGVYGAGQFVGWYNGHPDFAALNPDLQTTRAIVVGNGNVAVDVARVLTKTPAEMATSDLARHAASLIHASALEEVLIAGRRGPYQVSFTPKELGEMGELERAVALVDPEQLPDISGDAGLDGGLRKVVSYLRTFATRSALTKPVTIRFQFFLRPIAVLGDSKVEAMRFAKTRLEGDTAVDTGDIIDVPCGLVIPCIGYRTRRIAGVPFDNDRGRFANTDGIIDVGLYCVGWARRGPTGTIGTNKPDGAMLAETIIANARPNPRQGREGLLQLIASNDLYVVSYTGWKAIEAAEVARAKPGAPREKFTHVSEMIEVLKNEPVA